MESVIKKIGKDESWVFIETQHGKIRVNYSLEDLEQIFKELFGKFKPDKIGVDFKLGFQNEKELPLVYTKKMIKSSLISLAKSGYDISSILNGQTEIKGFVERWDKLRNGLPFYIEKNNDTTVVYLIPPISITKHGKKDFWIEIILPSGCLELVMNSNSEVSEIKKVDNYIFLNNTNMIKIERGFICVTMPNDEVCVHGVGHIWKLNTKSLFEREYKVDEKVLGVVIENQFSVCHNFRLNDGREYFGYSMNNDTLATATRVQVVNNFDVNTFDPFKADYILGEQVVLKKAEILGFVDDKEHSRE